MSIKKTKTGMKARILFATVMLVLVAMACTSDLLSAPPVTLEVALTAAPVVTPSFDSAALSFQTDASVTVSVEYGKVSGTYTGSIPRTDTTDTSHSVTLTDLDAATLYYFHVISFLGTAKSYSSAEYSFTTSSNPGVLSITVAPSATTPTYTSLTITWTTNVACNHILEYGTVSGTYTASTVTTTIPITVHSETITGLLSGQRYYYRIHLLADGVNDVTSGQYYADTSSEAAPTAVQKARGVWIIGGISGSAITSTTTTIDLYDPVNNTWYTDVTAGSTGTYVPVSFAAYAAYNGKLYVFGGFDSTGTVRNLVQIYTISTNTWTNGANMPQARANIFATVLNGYIYILGGTTANAAVAYAVTYTPPAGCTSTIEYNVSGNTWVYTKVAFGTAGSERFSYAYDGTVYNLGGRTAAATLVSTNDGFLPFTVAQPVNGELDGAGTVELAMSAVRTGFTGGFYKPVTDPGFVYLVGGVSGTFVGTPASFINSGTTSAALINTVQYMHYPFAAPRTWVTGISYPVSIAFGATVVSTALSSPRIIHFGGTQALGASAAGQASGYWIPTPPGPGITWTDSWTSISTTGMSARWGQGAVTLNQ